MHIAQPLLDRYHNICFLIDLCKYTVRRELLPNRQEAGRTSLPTIQY